MRRITDMTRRCNPECLPAANPETGIQQALRPAGRSKTVSTGNSPSMFSELTREELITLPG